MCEAQNNNSLVCKTSPVLVTYSRPVGDGEVKNFMVTYHLGKLCEHNFNSLTLNNTK